MKTVYAPSIANAVSDTIANPLALYVVGVVALAIIAALIAR